MIVNPIFRGFNPDPSICRKGDDIYIAVSSFEWFPGIPIYHSRDMKNWELYSHGIVDEDDPNLRGLPSAKGLWAPSLTYCQDDDLFYLVYGVMRSMNARYFDVENYVITAPDPKGPWSKPVYLHSTGFDAAMFHDTDGRKYVVALEWETRSNYEKPGPICVVEYDPKQKRVTGPIKRVYRGGTDRGCIEGPSITKRNGYYYLMCAEGGTGYYHCTTMARSQSIWGPYEPDPLNPIITSQPMVANERADWDHLKPRYYNPAVMLQKAGHSSYVDLDNGETWLTYHCSRPFTENLRCTLGRETAIQQAYWTEDGWLRLKSGHSLPEELVTDSTLPEHPFAKRPDRDDFDEGQLALGYYAPRIDARGFTDLTARPGWLRIRGQEAGTSLNRTSIVARKLESVHCTAQTRLDFAPESYQHTAGLILYYDNMNFLYLYKYYSETLDSPALGLMQIENGIKTEYSEDRLALRAEDLVSMRVVVDGRNTQFYYSLDDNSFTAIGPAFDTSKLSDEYSQYGEFTGTFVGMTCGDRMLHSKYADFDYFELRDSEN